MTSYDSKMLNNIKTAIQKRRQMEADDARKAKPDLIRISDSLDEYYFTNKLNLYCTDLSYHIIYGLELEHFPLLQPILDYVEGMENPSDVLLIYNNIRKLLESINTPSDQFTLLYQSTFELIKNNEQQLSTEEALELYSLLNNYCIKRINKRENGWNKYFLLLNSKMVNLQFKKSTPQGVLQPSLFRNLIVTALSIKDDLFFSKLNTNDVDNESISKPFESAIDWTEYFFQKSTKMLPKTSIAKHYHIYCHAYLEFSKQNYPKAYKILQNYLNVRGTFLNLDFKILHLKILYETNIKKPSILEYDRIEIRKVLDAYRKLIQFERIEKQQLSYQLNYYMNFREVFGKLFKLYERFTNSISDKQKEELIKKKNTLINTINQNDFSYNEWLLDKIEEIN